MARRLFAANAVDRVLVAHFPHQRSIMHLDTIFTIVDHDAVNVFPHVLEEMEVYEITPGADRTLDVKATAGLIPALEAVLGRSLRVVTTGGDAIGIVREQWDDGNNTLAVAPGVVIAYARNTETNRLLRSAGIEVLELDASELCRGRGGSRCLTQPIERDPA
jgi:arginine deiminase